MTTTRGARRSGPSPIQQRSSPFPEGDLWAVNVFWLNLEQVRTCLRQPVRSLAERHPEIEAVWLYGSLARGDAVPGSDADLLMVLSDSQVSFLDRASTYQPSFCGIGVDILAYTRAELASMREEHEADSEALPAALGHVQSEGVCLFQRNREKKGVLSNERRR
jgi:predicted nucleotidyltransferase